MPIPADNPIKTKMREPGKRLRWTSLLPGGELDVWPTWATWISTVCRFWPSASDLRWTSLPRKPPQVGRSDPVKVRSYACVDERRLRFS